MKQVERMPLWDQAYAEIRRALLAGRFEPGQRILLRDTAEELGISLTPVRDAVNRLIAEHVLERGSPGQGGGAVVPQISLPRFEELLTIRCDLEARAAWCAAQRATKDDVRCLGRQLDRMRALIRSPRLDGYLDLHRAFHFGVYRASQMPILQGLIENVWLRCGPVLNYVLPDYVLTLKGTDLHAIALDALARGDADGAADAIRRDIREAGAYLVGLVDGDGLIKQPASAAPRAPSRVDEEADAIHAATVCIGVGFGR